MVKNKKFYLNAYLSAAIALVLTVSIIRYPKDAFDASVYGLKLWLEIVLPALLPFFAMADIMMGLGVVHFIGVLLEPIMKTVFKIPGVGAFAVAMGLASGYPIGAKITGRLRRQNLCTQVEAERLVSFANTADPLYMIGAVAIGMFGMPELGVTIALAHYLAVAVVGFLMRFHKGPEGKPQPHKSGYFSRALQALVDARAADGRPFGHLFNDAVRETFGSMLFVGGCIMMFSVLLRILTVSGIITAFSNLLMVIFAATGVRPDIINTLVSGLFEITIGSQAASMAQAPIAQKAMTASAIIAWSGLSVHTQVAAMVHGTDIRLWPYLIARFLHAILAAILTVILLQPGAALTSLLIQSVPVFTSPAYLHPTFLTRLWASTQISLSLVGILLAVGVTAIIFQRILFFWIHSKN